MFGLEGLLHDASEAYVSDIFGPLKDQLPEFEKVEDSVYQAIATKYGLPPKMSATVKYADKAALVWELRAFKNCDPVTDISIPDFRMAERIRAMILDNIEFKAKIMKPGECYLAFLERFIELTS